MIVVRAIVVSELGRKAYWCGDMRLCVVRWSMSCLFMRVSKIFPIMGRSDMGRKFAEVCCFVFRDGDCFSYFKDVWVYVLELTVVK